MGFSREHYLQKVALGTPREIKTANINEILDHFTYAAKLAYEAGFKSVELHGAHSQLLRAFLTAKIS